MSKTVVHIKNNIVTKTYPEERRVFFNNEIFCLNLLKDNFTKKFSNKYPFPSILNINNERCSFTMEYCGESLDTFSHKEYPPLDLVEQLSNIFLNLKENNILYKDIHPANICYSNNVVFLIDFEVAFVMDCENYPHINQFAKKGYKWSKPFYDSYYLKPKSFDIFNTLSNTSEKREWKGKPWSITRMFTI
jgi:hypothetical protein